MPPTNQPDPEKPRITTPEFIRPNRRQLIAGIPVVAVGISGNFAEAWGQAKTDTPIIPVPVSPVPANIPSPVRIIALKAIALEAKLGNKDAAASTLFRLHDLVAPLPSHDAGEVPPTPVFRAKFGESLSLKIENGLTTPLAFHLRGMRQPNVMDGVPGLTGTPIVPGASTTIDISTRQPGTFILTPSLPASMPEHNARGLNAILIVEEASPQPVDHDFALAVSDIRLDAQSVIMPDFFALRDAGRVGRLGNRLISNGKPAPGRMMIRPGARIRLRLVNVSNARILPLRVTNLKAEVIAIDSTPCQPFDPLKRTVILSPGSRIEMIVDVPEKPHEDGLIEAKIGDGIPIFAFRTQGEPLPAKPKFTALPDPGLPPAIRLQDATRADLVITGGLPRDAQVENALELAKQFPDPSRFYQVNGMPGGFSGKPVASVARGKVLVLALTNRAAWPQVLAVHGHAFRLLHPYDDGWEPYFLDTLYLTPGTTARIALIADNPGKWAIRSMIAEHYAAGVATWFQVT